MSVNSSHRRFGAASVVVLLAALGVPLAATPAAAAVFDPPGGGRGITVFPERDFVMGTGYTPGVTATVQVLRSGVVIGTASSEVGPDGIVEINHAAPSCWDLPSTPDLRADDEIRVSTGLDTDVTRTAGVTVIEPATQVGVSNAVTIKGTAPGAIAGARIPIEQLEARVVNPARFSNGARTVRAPGDGQIAYDDATGNTWTATFPLTTGDRVLALANTSESRGMWVGRDPLAVPPPEITIYEFGALGGPALGCLAPLAAGPSVPNMTDATDTGASSTDNVTNATTPTFTGVTGLASATTVTLYVDNVANGTATVGAGGLYSLTPTTPLINGPHVITARETGLVPETRGVGSLSVTIDTAPALPPSVNSTMPGSPGMSSAPLVKGTAEAGSTVRVYTNSTCTSAAVSGSAATFATPGISVPVALSSTTSFFATAVDLAGNPASACSPTSVSFTQDSVAPPVPSITAGPPALVSSTSAAFAFSDSEPGVTFGCSLDGAALTACTSATSVSALAQGAHSFSVHAVDPAGNLSGVASRSWTVDTVAPTTSITSPVGSEVTVTNPTFGFAASEVGSTMSCSLDGAVAAPCTTSTLQTSSGLAAGLHRFTVTATDPAGNTGPAATFTFLVRLPVALTPPAVGAPAVGAPAVGAPAVVTAPALGTPVVVTPRVITRPIVVAPGLALSRVIARSPAVNTMGASRTNNITTRFGTAVTGVSRSSFTLRTKAGKAVAAVVTYNARTRVATLNPTRTLAADTTYIVTLNNRIKIGAGKSLAPTRWSFTTGPRPTVTARSQAPNARNVSRGANVTAKFSERVSGISAAAVTLKASNGKVVAAVVTYNSRTRVVTLNPSRTLGAGVRYTVSLSSRIRDAAGNPLTAVRWSFSTRR